MKEKTCGTAYSIWLNPKDVAALELLAVVWGTTKQATVRRALHEVALREAAKESSLLEATGE